MPAGTIANMTLKVRTSSNTAAPVRTLDWERIEVDYRINRKSLREIGREHGVSEGAIRKRARRDNWAKDLAAKVRAKADALVRKELVRNEVRGIRAEAPDLTKPSMAEKHEVQVEANQMARVRIGHRTDAGKTRLIVQGLFLELSELSKAAAREKSPTVTSLAARSSVAKQLTDALKTAINLEREAYGLTGNEPDTEDPFTSMLRRLKPRTFMPVEEDPDLLPGPRG
tara:strand:+ start:360 stop:1040 length:681 start_codon:yes stop_codon:yes gene_type:complete